MKIQLKNQMSKKLLTIKSDTTLAEAHRLMSNEWIRHLPVVSDDELCVIGIISDRDLLSAKADHEPVKSVMSTNVRSCEITTPLKTIVQSMIDHKISSYLITHDGAVQGIITSEDMLVLLNQLLKNEAESEFNVKKWLSNPLAQNAMNMLSQAGI